MSWASNPNSAANADPDGDGLTNIEEYEDGTNPTVASSHFYTLTIDSGNAVTVSPAGSRFAPGTVVTLTAPPIGAMQFNTWTGDIVTTANPLTVTMNQNYELAPQYGAMPLDNSVPSFTTVAGTTIDALGMQSNGQVIVAGSFQAEDGVAHYGLARLNADGSLDNTFGPSVTLGTEGIGPAVFEVPGSISAIAVQSNNQILVAGDFNYIDGGQTSPYITRLNTDGSVDTTFQAAVPMYSSIQQMAVSSSGTILVLENGTLLELNSNGSLDTSFSAALPTNAYVEHVVMQTDGKVIYNGSAPTGTAGFGRFELQWLGRLVLHAGSDAGVLRPLGLAFEQRALYRVTRQSRVRSEQHHLCGVAQNHRRYRFVVYRNGQRHPRVTDQHGCPFRRRFHRQWKRLHPEGGQ